LTAAAFSSAGQAPGPPSRSSATGRGADRFGPQLPSDGARLWRYSAGVHLGQGAPVLVGAHIQPLRL